MINYEKLLMQRKIIVKINIKKGKSCKKYCDFKENKTTLGEFLNSIDQSDPIKIERLYYNTYIVLDVDVNLTFLMLLNEDCYKNVLYYVNDIELIYPEIKKWLEKHRLNNNNCTECEENTIRHKIFSIITIFGGYKRNIKKLKPLLTDTAYEFLQTYKGLRDKGLLARITSNNKNDLVRQCKDCCKKHLRKAILQIMEYQSNPDEYVQEWHLACGNLSLAEEHLLLDFPDISKDIREIRLRVEKKKFDVDIWSILELL